MSSSPSAFPSLFESSVQWESSYGNGSICSPGTFGDLGLANIEVLQLTADNLQNYTWVAPPYLPDFYRVNYSGLNICNITVSYTHPGWNDTVVTNIILPTKGWNGRYQAQGGSGWIAGGPNVQFTSGFSNLREGFAISSTNGGHTDDPLANAGYESDFAFKSEGNVDWPGLIDFGHLSIHEQAVMSKAAIQTFYGQSAAYSYWFGGSQGGRQGAMAAQKYPEDYDGIIALFPAIYFTQFAAATAWPTFVMDEEGVYPDTCEFLAITAAALEACDQLDGLQDGFISQPGSCLFEAKSVVGKEVTCGNSTIKISEGAAKVMQKTWDGPRSSDGKFQWHGFPVGSNVTSTNGLGVANTICITDNTTHSQTCDAVPNPFGEVWFKFWGMKNSSSTLRNISHEKWDDLLHATIREYDGVYGASDTDLTAFKRAGGKLLSWHGIADALISVNGTTHYYDEVAKNDPDVHNYFRLFLAPGIGHGFGFSSEVPSMNKYIVDWVENGNAPETLRQNGTDDKGNKLERDLCLYPKVQHYNGGDATKVESFECV